MGHLDPRAIPDREMQPPRGPGLIASVVGTLGLILAIGIMVRAGSMEASDSEDRNRLIGRSNLTWRTHPIFGLSWSPDGRRLAASGLSTEVRVWETSTGLGRTFDSEDQSARFLQGWSEDGRELAVSSIDGRVEFWGVTGDSSKPDRRSVETPGPSMARAREGATIRLWGPTDLRLDLLPIEGRAANAMAFTPDSRKIASAGLDGSIRIFDFGSGRLQHAISIDGVGINSVTFSRDGTKLASAGSGPAHVWDVDSGRELASLENRSGGYSTLAFSPDARQLAGASWGGKIVIWDVASGRELAQLIGFRSQILAMAWSPDGRRLATGGHDSVVRIWDVSAWK